MPNLPYDPDGEIPLRRSGPPPVHEPGGDPPLPDAIVGQRIVEIRDMTDAELDAEGWEPDFHGRPPAIVLENGTVLYPSRDEEGNGGGALFGTRPDGVPFGICAVEVEV